MELPVVNHKDYVAKIDDDHKFPIKKFGELADYLLKEKINSDKLSKFIANCMDDKKAEDIRIINLKKIENSVTDYFVLATGNSNIHIDAIADGVQKNVLKKYNERPWKKEGLENKEWILIDFVNVYFFFR